MPSLPPSPVHILSPRVPGLTSLFAPSSPLPSLLLTAPILPLPYPTLSLVISLFPQLIIGVPEGEEKEQRTEDISEEVMTENFPHLVEGRDTQTQEAQRVPNKVSPKRPPPSTS